MKTRATGSNETDLLTWDGATLDRRRVTDVLVVTTTVWVVDGVHGNTTSTRPAVTLDTVLVVGTAGLQQWLVNTTATSNNTDSSTSRAWHRLLHTRRQADTRRGTIGIVTNDGRVVTRCAGKRTTVTNLLLDVADNRTLRQRAERQDVTDAQQGLLTAVHKLTRVHTLGSNERLSLVLVVVRVTERNAREWRTTEKMLVRKRQRAQQNPALGHQRTGQRRG